ncbi:MAG: hypothetical protein JNL70_25680 [Saprospiraceae bacterium]|nr:hypothetical protein [Saprospiraceae bacterium]
MAKNEKKYPEFECSEYEYGDLSHREYYGSITATFNFTDGTDVLFNFYFKDFLDFHKRKKTDFHRTIDRIYSKIRGWGSRHFPLIKKLQEEEGVDMFLQFALYAEQNEENELIERYESTKRSVAEYLSRIESEAADKNEHVNDSDTINDTDINSDDELIYEQPVQTEAISNDAAEEEEDDILIDEEDQDEEEENEEEEEEDEEEEEEEDNEDEIADENKADEVMEEKEEDDDYEESPYDRDRKKFRETVEAATDDMYEALKINFFPQMEYFHRRYPTRWKTLNENIESLLQNFEEGLQSEMLPYLDESAYRDFDIRYNSQKADATEEEPPTAR